MRKYIFIGIGGFLGAIARYAFKGVHVLNYLESLPVNTLMINVTGSFILAVVLTIAFEVSGFDADIRVGIAAGFLGAFTTFSTLCKETVGLINQGEYFSAITYMTVSIMLGLAAVYMGFVVAREAVLKLLKVHKE